MFAFETKIREIINESMEIIHNSAEFDRRKFVQADLTITDL